MPRICYDTNAKRRVEANPGRLEAVKRANAIITDYRAQGFDLTLRQLYYQFVSRGWIANKDLEYKRLGDIIGEARMGGLIDWEAIVDRTRHLRSNNHWDDPAQIVEAVAQQFRYDLWENQRTHVEVWIEKDALVGILDDVCRNLDIGYFSCRGYTSASELWQAAMRLRRKEKEGKETVVLHFGDHDPSGIDMTRDITERLHLFGAATDVRRLALTMDQIEQYNPPPNPAKVSDPRANAYLAEHGDESWELDALEPSVITTLITEEVESLRDDVEWNLAVERQETAREELSTISQNYEKAVELLKDLEG